MQLSEEQQENIKKILELENFMPLSDIAKTFNTTIEEIERIENKVLIIISSNLNFICIGEVISEGVYIEKTKWFN